MGSLSNSSKGFNFKIVLLGEGCVGKTSLVLRYVEDKFSEKHISTLQASFLTKRINVDGQRINLSIWDTAGQERFHALGPIYYRDSHGAILVYDVTDEDSFRKVKNWVRELRKMLGNDICLAIAGNKIDLDKDRHVSIEMAESYSNEVDAFHIETSAKLNEGVDDLFVNLSNQMVKVSREKDDLALQNASSSPGRSLQIVDDETVASKGCCG